jgi:hypothetical protein
VARTFWRIVKGNPPAIDDFKSHAALGRQPRIPTPELLAAWDKLSVYEEQEQALAWAVRLPRLGNYIARLEVPDDVPAERTNPRNPGHYSLTAPAEILCQCVTEVIAVQRPRRRSL